MIKEWEMQAYVSTELKRRGIFHHGDQNAAKRSPKTAAIAKATGMRAGWPDLTVIPDIGKTVYFELKVKGNKQSQAQKETQALLEDYGYMYYLIISETPEEAWQKVRTILNV